MAGQARQQRYSQRRRQRGAAMVEAAVSIPFFITIFVALAFVGKLYIEKQRTLSSARQLAWVYSMKNCDGQPPTQELQNQDAGPIPQQDGMDFSSTGQFEGAPGGDTVSKGSRTAVATVKGSANAGTQQKVYEKKIQTTVKVTCNEKPQKGNIQGVLSTAWGIFTGW